MIKGYNGKMVEGAKEMKRLTKKSIKLKIKMKGGKVKVDKLEKDKKENDSHVEKLTKNLAVSSRKMTKQHKEIKELKDQVVMLLNKEIKALDSEEEGSDCEIVSEVKGRTKSETQMN